MNIENHMVSHSEEDFYEEFGHDLEPKTAAVLCAECGLREPHKDGDEYCATCMVGFCDGEDFSYWSEEATK